MPYKDIEKRRESSKRWNYKNSEKMSVYIKKYIERLKNAALELLGGKCSRCSFDDIRALQFDHINGGGLAEKKTRKRNHYKNIIESVLKKENKYQILCANCNWIKRCENGEVRNGKVRKKYVSNL